MKRTSRLALASACAALALAPPPAAGAWRPFTIDQVRSAPFPGDLAVSPDRRALVWTVHQRGARNVAVWKDGTTRLVTHEMADDGQDLSAPQLTPDASGDSVSLSLSTTTSRSSASSDAISTGFIALSCRLATLAAPSRPLSTWLTPASYRPAACQPIKSLHHVIDDAQRTERT
jgi:hypothetical protein